MAIRVEIQIGIVFVLALSMGWASVAKSRPSGSGTAAQTVAATQSEEARSERLEGAWRAAIARTPPQGRGCFTAFYPLTVWKHIRCVTAPLQPYLPTSGVPRITAAGAGNDYAAGSTNTLVSSAVGSFPTVKDLTSEIDANGNPNVYSLQLNSNFMPNDPACSGASDPGNCLGWEQFVYSSGSNTAFIQYWLIHYGSNCPDKKWALYGDSCYMNSEAVPVPPQKITELPHLLLSGSAVWQGMDTVILTTKKKAYSRNGDDTVDLATGWNAAEFNIFGDCCNHRAYFNSGASLAVEIDLTNGSTHKPLCQAGAGTTAETNNMSLRKCSTSGGTPSVQFTEEQTLVSFDVPGANEPLVAAINKDGVTTGYYQGSDIYEHSFLRMADGEIVAFDAESPGNTMALDINDAGVVVGDTDTQGFVRATDGQITLFKVAKSNQTAALEMNSSGTIVGVYNVFRTDHFILHGFFRTSDGAITTFDVPGASQNCGANSSSGTRPSRINNLGYIVGYYYDKKCKIRGFIRNINGAIAIFDPPSSQETDPYDINDAGTVVGVFRAPDGWTHGFLRAADGTFASIDPPGARYTDRDRINNAGIVVGTYLADADGEPHGFVRGNDGKIETIDTPLSAGTELCCIGGGNSFAGTYYDPGFETAHGLVGSP